MIPLRLVIFNAGAARVWKLYPHPVQGYKQALKLGLLFTLMKRIFFFPDNKMILECTLRIGLLY
jgi:hypothetical protein